MIIFNGIITSSSNIIGDEMDIKQQKKNAQAFIKRWENRGNERQDSQSFWLDLLQSVYGIEKPTEYIRFEIQLRLTKQVFIDGFIDATKVLIEQKGSHKDLNKAIKQSDGTYLTPFQQAKRYATDLPYSQRPRWIVTCNFKSSMSMIWNNQTVNPRSLN